MLFSAVSVLVDAQSSSEIPEGLMNNPVYDFYILIINSALQQLTCLITRAANVKTKRQSSSYNVPWRHRGGERGAGV